MALSLLFVYNLDIEPFVLEV